MIDIHVFISENWGRLALIQNVEFVTKDGGSDIIKKMILVALFNDGGLLTASY